MSEFGPGALPYTYWQVSDEQVEQVDGGLIDERLLTIYVNLQEVATMMCSPVQLESLVLGFLYNEGVIRQLSDVALLRLNATHSAADVLLSHSDFTPPRRLTITSGCGGGVTFQNLATAYPPLATTFQTTPQAVLACIPALGAAGVLYNQVRGVHTAALLDGSQLLLGAEDVGRHNAVDKIAGMALQQGVTTHDKILLSSGRISSEMANKARHLGIPLVISRTAPTSMAVQLATAWGICLVGYARRQQFRVYTHPQRVGLKPT